MQLTEINTSQDKYPKEKALHQLFEDVVKRFPDAIAVIYEDHHISYKTLNEHANQLAHYLREAGACPGVTVGVSLDHSIELIIGLLAILKTGGAYLPLDTSYPVERLCFMLDDAGSPILLTHSDFSKNFPTYTGVLFQFDKDWENLKNRSTENMDLTIFSKDLAYVFYTSGSTGKPKGVMSNHLSVTNRFIWAWTHYPFTEYDVCCTQTNIGFVDSLWDILGTLLHGIKLVVYPTNIAKDPERLMSLLQKHMITRIIMVPSFLRTFLNYYPDLSWEIPFLQHWEVTGEIFSEQLRKDFLVAMPDVRLLDVYGATEATSVIYFELSLSNGEVKTNTMTLSNTQIYILDKDLQSVPGGILGELCIGGIAVTEGYLNRPDASEQKFITSPFDSEHKDKIYRTGDLARYLPGGNIEFCGRVDDQVKIRGVRIELGEIESTLMSHEDVAEAVVVAREDELNEKRLVAYIVPQEKSLVTLKFNAELNIKTDGQLSILEGKALAEFTENLRKHLYHSLPEYMVPAFFVYINKLPLTPNGKVDRKVLPSPDLSIRHLWNDYVAPRNALEVELCDIWTDVLKIEKIGVFDNFFKLGGHSLLAVQIISRIRQQYTVNLSIKAFFENPVIADLGKIINVLKKGLVTSLIPPLVAINDKQSTPLSFSQQRLWFLDQLLPGKAIYNLPTVLKLKGNLNIIALENALNTIIQRHEALRTIFHAVDGEAYQVILPEVVISLSQNFLDLSHLKIEEAEVIAKKTIRTEVHTPFNLSTGPLVRITLLRISEQEHSLIITMHHIISDVWSMSILYKELSVIYNAYSEGKDVSLDPLPIQYKDFAIWQKSWLQGELLEQQLTYWQKQLDDAPDLLRLPADRSRPNEPTYQGEIYQCFLPKEFQEQLHRLAQDQQVSLFMTLLAALQILLYRYTGQHDIVVGSPIANRSQKETEELIGFFVNTIALRTIFEGTESYIDVLNKVKGVALDAYQHQDVPFEQLVDHLNVERNLSRNPIFQVLFTFEANQSEDGLALNNLAVSSVSSSYSVARFDLFVGVYEQNDGMAINFEYATDLFNERTIIQFATHFQELVKAITRDPLKSISSYPILTLQENERLLVQWNETAHDYQGNKGVHQLFEEQAERTPNNIAVECEDSALTYRELNERANQLAHYLRKKGVGPDKLVAIAIDRSIEMVIGILGILKAGGAYVPLDPSYPKERLDYMLEDSGAPFIVSRRKELEALPTGHCIVIDLDDIKEELETPPTTSPEGGVLPGNLAYVIYTSGSTGRPKGVGISHHSAVAYLSWAKVTYDCGDAKPILFHGSICFDMSITSLFVPLLSGAPLQIIVEDFAKMLEDRTLIEKFGFIKLTPSHLKLIKESGRYTLSDLSDSFIIGGEELRGEHFTDRSATLFNEYGPTEATVACSLYKVNETEDYRTVPIGRPIWNTQMYILDRYLNPVPVGVEGEIYIGGVGLARGYLNKPGLTAERFVPNPFDTGARLYKTGDLGRYLLDGNVECLGRIDHQVKIRGYRIELGEIEKTLMEHGDVASSVVLAREDDDGTKRLIAYVIPGEFTPSISELRDFLEKTIPEYMIPSHFVFIESIPLTSNGKVDERALPATDFSLRSKADSYIAPKTPLEVELVEIWSEVLKIDHIGINDNFFRNGGDSIISIQLVAKARKKGLSFSIKDVFEHPTIAELAKVAHKSTEVIATVDQTPLTGRLPLTPIQHWFFERDLFNRNHYNQAVLLNVNRTISSSLLKKVFFKLFTHHDILRAQYFYEEGKWVQTYGDTPLQESNMIEPILIEEDLSSSIKEGTDIKALLHERATVAHASLDIAKGPLIKIVHFLLGENLGSRLLIVMHHLIIDGVSWRIFLDDLDSLMDGKDIPQKTTSYREWGQALLSYAGSEQLLSEIPYWQGIENSITALPVDFSNTSTPRESDVDTIVCSLSAKETHDLLTKAPFAYGTEINDILLTALLLSIGEWQGFYELSLLLEGHGREDIETGIDLSRTIGWFTSIFPVILKTEESNNLGKTIKLVKECLRKIPNKGIGYGVIRYLNQKKPVSFRKKPSISFNYFGQWDNTNKESSSLTTACESSGSSVSLLNQVDVLLNLNGEVRDSIFSITVSYSKVNYYQHTIETVANKFIKKLKEIIAHCIHSNTFGYTPSDFPLISLSQEEMDTTFGEIKNIESIYPLTPLQEGLLFQSLYSPESDAYFVQSVLSLEGVLDETILKKALQVLADHHPTLRTGIVWEGLNRPLQYVVKSVAAPLDIIDWSSLDEEKANTSINAFIQEDRKKGFNLSNAPLFRVTLIKKLHNQFILLWSQHHILIDGWSSPILMTDLFKAYNAIKSNKEPDLIQRRPYKDYLAWLQNQDTEKAEVFFRETFLGFEEPTRLSFKGIINSNTEKDYESYTFNLSEQDTRRLEEFSQQHNLTLNTLLQGVIGKILSTYTQKRDLAIGVTLSGRSVDLPGIEEMVGLFINTLPLRIIIDPQATSVSFLNSLQEKTQRLNDYVCTPLSEVQSWVSSSQRLFDVLFVFENYPWQEEEKNDTELKVTNIQGIEKTEYPLTIIAVPGKALHLIFNYQTEHFDKRVIERLGLHIKKTVCEIVSNPQGSLDQITILTPQEEATLLTEWNDTTKDYLKDKTVHELFETQVNLAPDNIAIVYEEQSLTYQQLNERINQLAHYLRNRGVTPDTPVAIAVERSLEMIVGILGILKAGGAYVPLDPSYPEDRLRFMLQETKTPMLLTQGKLKNQFKSYNGSIIILDDDWETIAKEPSFNPSVNTSSRHLAYVIYTSGSTGKPKGVMIDHAGLINRLTWMKDRYRIKNKDRVLQKTPFVFDVSVWELFLPLLVGATEIIAPPHVHKDPTLLLQLIKDGYVSVCHFVPSMLIGFLEMSPVLGQTSLRMVVTSGEALPSKVVKDYYMKYRAPLHNLYGPTEASIDVTAFYCSSDLIPENIPIGTPIYNTHIYILDKYLNPVPVGTQGEIYIGGVGLARGYLNKPGLTAERFVPNPFGTGERLYRTGDLGRYIPDGNIEFLGRIDHQVKIRGYRIELGEIERTIENSGMVQQVVVLCREDVPGHKRLVAYVVPKKKEGGEFVRSLQKVCLDCLPEYMHPSQWVVLDAFPLTSNGKLDRKALPMPEGREGMGGYQAPEGLMEERLAQLWSQLLGIEKIGRLDNFFQIGGDSIISIQLVSRARQQGMFFTVRQVFETPTLAALALHTKETEKNSLVSQDLVQGRVSLTPIQKWFFDQNPANPHHYNQAMWIKSESPVDLDKLHTALKIVYHHHDGFRLRYKKSAEGWMQEYTEKDTPFTLEVLENVPKENLKDICTKLQSSLNLEEGPLSRVVWVAETQELLWVIHHLIVDGVSWRILLEDLNLAYAGKELGSKSHSYLSWSQSLHNYTPKNQEIEYYQAQMQDIPRLPSDYAYPGRASLQNTRTISTGLSEEITKQFLQRAHQSYGTRPDDLLLLALVYAIGDCFGKYQVCVDLEGHGREDLGESLDLTRTLGWFTSIHPVVLSLPEPTNIGQSIKHIKEYLRSVPKKGVSYGILSQIHKICTPVQGDLLFNYLGQWGNIPRNEEIFSFRAGDTGVNISENNPLSHSLIINSEINQGKLLFYWYYSTHHYRAETIENLSQSFKERLEALIEYCSEEKNYGYSPSDFPHIKLQGKQLDKLLEKLKG